MEGGGDDGAEELGGKEDEAAHGGEGFGDYEAEGYLSEKKVPS